MTTDREALAGIIRRQGTATMAADVVIVNVKQAAAALLAAGWRGPDASEVLAWAVIREDGAIFSGDFGCKEEAAVFCYSGERVARVAIRVIEEPSDGV